MSTVSRLAAARRVTTTLAITALLALAACSGDDPASTVGPDDPIVDDEQPQDPTPPRPAALLPASELTAGLYGWPETDFGRGNNATIHIDLRAGDPATDFTLRDRAGEAHTLSDLLIERPVLLVLGSYT